MKVTFKHEADNNKNESITDTFDIDPGEFALMIATDREQRAAATGVPLDQVKPCTPQRILDELWNAEEAATHQAVRADRGKGKEKCTCGAGCGPRRGCRVPNNKPFSYEQMLRSILTLLHRVSALKTRSSNARRVSSVPVSSR